MDGHAAHVTSGHSVPMGRFLATAVRDRSSPPRPQRLRATEAGGCSWPTIRRTTRSQRRCGPGSHRCSLSCRSWRRLLDQARWTTRGLPAHLTGGPRARPLAGRSGSMARHAKHEGQVLVLELGRFGRAIAQTASSGTRCSRPMPTRRSSRSWPATHPRRRGRHHQGGGAQAARRRRVRAGHRGHRH